jgi:hypothetical protein
VQNLGRETGRFVEPRPQSATVLPGSLGQRLGRDETTAQPGELLRERGAGPRDPNQEVSENDTALAINFKRLMMGLYFQGDHACHAARLSSLSAVA